MTVNGVNFVLFGCKRFRRLREHLKWQKFLQDDGFLRYTVQYRERNKNIRRQEEEAKETDFIRRQTNEENLCQ